MPYSFHALEDILVSVLRARRALAENAVSDAQQCLDEALSTAYDALGTLNGDEPRFPGQDGPLEDYIRDLQAIIVAQNQQLRAFAAQNAALSDGLGLTGRLTYIPFPMTPHR